MEYLVGFLILTVTGLVLYHRTRARGDGAVVTEEIRGQEAGWEDGAGRGVRGAWSGDFTSGSGGA